MRGRRLQLGVSGRHRQRLQGEASADETRRLHQQEGSRTRSTPPAVAWKTWREQRDSFERHVIPRLGGVELQKLTAAQLTAHYGDLLREGGPAGQGLSPTTVRDLHRRLRKALADAVRWGLMERNPADLADPPPAKVAASARRAAMQTWDEDELRAFLEATSEDPLGTLWLVAAMRDRVARSCWACAGQTST